MADHADTIRVALNSAMCGEWGLNAALTALDALVAELAEARAENERTAHIRRAWDQGESELEEARRALSAERLAALDDVREERVRAEAAEAENARLRAALRPFVDWLKWVTWHPNVEDDLVDSGESSYGFTYRDLARARAALRASGGSSTDGAA